MSAADPTSAAGWCDAAPPFHVHDGGSGPHPKTDDCKRWRPAPKMPVVPPPPPHRPVGGSEGDQLRGLVRWDES